MRHVNKVAAEAAVVQTTRRLDRIAVGSSGKTQVETFRDTISALSIHLLMIGQSELSTQVQEILIGDTNVPGSDQ